MPTFKSSPFIFVVCQVGAEPALKKELSREHPELKFAYSRPGFVTFKCGTALAPDFQLRSVFARAYGLSLLKLAPKDLSVQEAASRFYDWAEESLKGASSICLHLWERDRFQSGEEPPGFVAGEWKAAALEAVEKEGLKRTETIQFRINQKPERQEIIVDLILVEASEWWIGMHQQGPSHSPYPGGNPMVSLHPEAPSRAYVKLEEGLLWSGAPVHTVQFLGSLVRPPHSF